jgi:DNA-binding CsgD family transcriptional regulator
VTGGEVGLGLVRDKGQGEFRRGEREQLGALAPHLASAFRLGAEAQIAREEHALTLLAAIGYPAATLDIEGLVVAASAEFLNSAHPWTGVIGSPLKLNERRANQSLTRHFENGLDDVHAIPLHVAGRVSFGLHLVPLPPSAREPFRTSRILVLAAGGPRRELPARVLHALLGLSPAEASLTSDLVNGLSINQIATNRGKSPHTLRNQLKAILNKTGSRRQSELAGLIGRILPPSLSSPQG